MSTPDLENYLLHWRQNWERLDSIKSPVVSLALGGKRSAVCVMSSLCSQLCVRHFMSTGAPFNTEDLHLITAQYCRGLILLPRGVCPFDTPYVMSTRVTYFVLPTILIFRVDWSLVRGSLAGQLFLSTQAKRPSFFATTTVFLHSPRYASQVTSFS